MAVILRASERKDRRRGQIGPDGHRTRQRTWFVETDELAGSNQVETAIGIPQRYTGYVTETETDLETVVISITSKQLRKSDLLWEVDVKYSSNLFDRDPEHEDPRLRFPKMSMVSEVLQVPVVGTLKQGVPITPEETDIYQDPILNSAGDPYSPQPLVDESRPVVTIVRNEATYSPSLAIVYQDAVNNDNYLGAEPRQLKMESITTPGRQTAVVGGVEETYYPVTYRMIFRREGWDLRNLDIGARGTTFGSTTGTIKAFVDAESGIPELRKLDGAGGALSTTASSTEFVYRKDRHYREEPYVNLNLPNTFI